MKKINLLIAALAFVGLTSCDYDGSDDAKVTKYVTIELTGGNQTLVPVGSEYTDPGYTATEGTEDVTSKVVVSGDQVDPDKVGIYNVTYSAKNVDGFAAEVTRTVLVYDPAITTDITGTYTVEKGEDLYPDQSDFFTRYVIKGNTVTLTQLAKGLYSISDWWGGLYDKTVGYGSAYCATGYFQLNADNTITGISASTPWGDVLERGDGIYDPTTGKVVLNVELNYYLKMTLSK